MTLKKLQKPDSLLIGLVIFFSLFGLLMVYDASVIEAYRDFGDKFYFVKQQLKWLVLGLIVMLISANINYRLWQKYAGYLLLLAILFLILVLLPFLGTEVMGARRWLKIGNFSFQPAEFTKIAFIIYLASWLSQRKQIKQLLIVAVAILALLILEPDLSSAVVIIVSGFMVYFISGGPLLYLFGGSLIGGLLGFLLIWSSAYRRKRLLTFLNPSFDPQGASYHIRQILIALGSGGFWGQGVGKSRQKYEYLPASTTDSIFAVIAEEIGFLGSLVIIILFLSLIYRGFKIGRLAPDNFGQLLATGIIGWIGLQFFINLAAIVALAPFTGLPLPFISYGGSSTVITLFSLGILLNISRYQLEVK